MSHRLAVLTMLVATLLWSIAGVVTLRLESARSSLGPSEPLSSM